MQSKAPKLDVVQMAKAESEGRIFSMGAVGVSVVGSQSPESKPGQNRNGINVMQSVCIRIEV